MIKFLSDPQDALKFRIHLIVRIIPLFNGTGILELTELLNFLTHFKPLLSEGVPTPRFNNCINYI